MSTDADPTPGDTFNIAAALSGGPTFIPGYGCYVNADDIVKIDVSSNGVVHTVLAWTRSEVGAAGKANAFAALTRGFDDEEDAQRACNAIVAELVEQGVFSVASVDGRSKATWPAAL